MKLWSIIQSVNQPMEWHHLAIVCLSDNRLQHPAVWCCSFPPLAWMTPCSHLRQGQGVQQCPWNGPFHSWYPSSCSVPTCSPYHLPCGHQLSGSVGCQDKVSSFQRGLLNSDPWITTRLHWIKAEQIVVTLNSKIIHQHMCWTSKHN